MKRKERERWEMVGLGLLVYFIFLRKPAAEAPPAPITLPLPAGAQEGIQAGTELGAEAGQIITYGAQEGTAVGEQVGQIIAGLNWW